mgnify:CR=1 FL=1
MVVFEGGTIVEANRQSNYQQSILAFEDVRIIFIITNGVNFIHALSILGNYE